MRTRKYFPLISHSVSHERQGMSGDKFETFSLEIYETRNKSGVTKKCRAIFPYKDDDGKWRKKSVTLNSNPRGRGSASRLNAEAEEVRAQLNAEAKEASKACETVAEYFKKYVDARSLSIERSSANELRRILRTHIAPTIGKIELDELTPDDVQAWVTMLSKEYAPSTVKKCLTNLRSAIREAVDRDRLAKDPTRGVKNPKLPASKPNALDERGRAKVASFIALDPAKPLNIGFALALYMGLREGEICGLRWRCVDLDAKTLEIRETIGRDGSKWYVKEPKTGGSIRKLYIPDSLAEALRARHAHMGEENLGSGLTLDELFVVGDPAGGYMQPHYLSTRWRIAADALELIGTQGRRPTFHDLRHTFATAAIAHGVDIKTVSSFMGHANAAMTMNTYADADPDAKRRGAETVARAYQEEIARHVGDGEVLEFSRTGTDE